jgi:hypothetical protein
MTDFYDWLDSIRARSYAPASPFYAGPSQMDVTTSQYLDDGYLDDDGSPHFDYSDTQAQVDPMTEMDIDPALMNIDPALLNINSAPRKAADSMHVSSHEVITVPSHLVDASRKVLIYLAQVLDIPVDVEGPSKMNLEPVNDEPAFTQEELEMLEPIPEISEIGPNPSHPSAIDDIPVVTSPQVKDIEELVDCR